MSDEFCAGVQILLKRVESNPEDFTLDYGPWKRLMDSVLAYKRGGDYDDRQYLKPLTDAEIDALHAAFLPLARQQFDSWVMREVLAEPTGELKYRATERYVAGFNDPRMLTQNTIRPGSIIPVGGGVREKEREGVMRRIQNSIKELRKQTP
jgi:hypothetical protein